MGHSKNTQNTHNHSNSMHACIHAPLPTIIKGKDIHADLSPVAAATENDYKGSTSAAAVIIKGRE